MRVKTILPGMLMLALTAACGGQELNVMNEPPATWTVPAKYGFVLSSECGERALIGRFQVTVEDDKVVRTAGLDEAAKRALMLRVADLVPTLRALEAEAETARRDGAEVVQVERDLGDAHPIKITIDPARNTTDDESCYTIEDYTIGLTSAPAPTPSR